MKTILKRILFCIVITSCIASCSDEEVIDMMEENEEIMEDMDQSSEIVETAGQITADDFESYAGDVGMILDARSIARMGYTPTQVTLNVNANSGDYTQTIPLDENSFMGKLSIPLDGLSEEAKQELANGVEVTSVYMDANNNVIHQEVPAVVSFLSNPPARSANTSGLDETEENQSLDFSLDTAYYLQQINTNGTPTGSAWRHLDGAGFNDLISSNAATFSGNEPDKSFTFFPIEGEENTFAIRHTPTLRYARVSFMAVAANGDAGTHFGVNLSPNTNITQILASAEADNFKFKFERQSDGSYIILSVGGGGLGSNLPINQAPGFGLTVNEAILNIPTAQFVEAEERRWNVVSTNIDWNITNIGTTILDPILPPATTGFSFNSTLTNCGAGELSQTVGADESETRTRVLGQEETISLSTANDLSFTTSIDAEVSATILGTGVTVNAGFETSYSHSWSATETTSNWEVTENTSEQTLFFERTVTVPPGSASLVYDVYQSYPETQVNFVQRMRVEGLDSETGAPLTGEEIRTMFYVSNFNGVITSIEPNSVVITLKGTLTLDKIIETESSVQDTSANCN